MPSIRAVAKEFTISVITVKNAYQRLEDEGYIYTHPGKGCFVKDIGTGDGRADSLKKVEKGIEYCKKCGCTKEEILSIVEKLF